MTDTPAIRPAVADDRPQLTDLIARFRESLGVYSARATEAGGLAGAELDDYLARGCPIFVAEEGGRLVGYLVCRVDGATVWAESLFVSPGHRRRGIGTRLYERAERLAAERGATTVYNWVHPTNHASIAFLRRRGYDVLNLIELRRPAPGETPRGSIDLGPETFRH